MELIYKSLILGLVQGLTEFLPVSSSGHLALVEHFMGVKGPGVAMETLLHVGTLAAVIAYFRKDILSLIGSFLAWTGLKHPPAPEEAGNFEDDKRLIVAIIAGTIPTGVIGVAGKDWFEGLFSKPLLVGGALLATALILFTAETFSRRGGEKEAPNCPGTVAALIIGIAQGVAIMPGISRSGITVAAGLLLGVRPAGAARFSFLLSVPAITGAFLLSVKDLAQLNGGAMGAYISGAVCAALVGYVAIGVFMAAVKKARLRWFALYCAVVGTSAIIAISAGA